VWGTGRTADEHRNADHTGTIVERKPLDLPGTAAEGLRFRFSDGRVVDCIAHARTTLHDLGDNIDTEEN
jgi:leucyl aminopeptidase (aminopeptidase T)